MRVISWLFPGYLTVTLQLFGGCFENSGYLAVISEINIRQISTRCPLLGPVSLSIRHISPVRVHVLPSAFLPLPFP